MPCSCGTHAKQKELYSDLVKAGKLELISSATLDYEETAILKCKLCGKKWKYSYTDSYHQPIVSWSKI